MQRTEMNDKADRLKAALRENLKRRKAHARERIVSDDQQKPVAAPEASKDKPRQT